MSRSYQHSIRVILCGANEMFRKRQKRPGMELEILASAISADERNSLCNASSAHSCSQSVVNLAQRDRELSNATIPPPGSARAVETSPNSIKSGSGVHANVVDLTAKLIDGLVLMQCMSWKGVAGSSPAPPPHTLSRVAPTLEAGIKQSSIHSTWSKPCPS